MADQVIGVTIKGIGDFSDVVSNVGSVQKALTKLKLPDKLGDNLNKNIANFYKEYDKYQKKIAEGIHTQGDQNAVNKSLNSMLNSYEKIINEFGKLSKQDFRDIFNLDEGAFASVQKRIKEIQAEIKKIKIDPKQLIAPMDEIEKMTKAKAVSGGGKGLDKIRMGIDANDIFLMKEGLEEISAYYDRFSSKMSDQKRIGMAAEIEKLKTPIENAISASGRLEQEARDLDKEFSDIGSGASRELSDVANALDKTKVGAEKVTDALKNIHNEEFSFNREAQNIDRQIQSYFGLSQMIRKVGDIARDAFATVKELDAAMTETAVVTNFSVGDMWEMLPTYTEQANQLGSTIKDVYDAATLYYQQGLNTNQAMGLANETLKMARIAGLDAAEATNMMTAALRGFNMEINQQSAQKINDIYSELAAITASDTKEIGSAMERTASIANSANMEFATTSAFLAQMIETTREAPENLGTAMKTIVARFQEMKQDPTKLVDSEGVAMDVNKVDKALKSIGVNLTNTKGEFRDLDDVFLDISAKWDSLSQGQQRYIATIAAGSRQQSRFIAMMSNYERTMELVDAANNSAGASQRQFEKTLDSMGSKLNMLKNAWDQFTMGLMNNQILKFGVDALTEGFTIVNKFIEILGELPPKPFEGITKSALTLITTLGMLNFGKKATRGLVMGGAGWWKGETSLTEGFKQGWQSSGQTGFFANRKNNQAERQGMIDGQAYGRGWAKAVQTIQTKQQTGKGIFRQTLDTLQQNKNIFGSDKNIVSQLFPAGGLSDEAQRDAEDYINTLRQELANKKITKEQLPDLIESGLGQTTGFSDQNLDAVVKDFDAKKVKSIGIGFTGLTTKINSAGVALSNFGAILQGTPLEPFGQILGTVGGALISLSTIVATTKASFLEQWAAATAAAMGTEAEGVAAMTAAAKNGTLAVSSITAAGGMATLGAAIWAALWPLLAIAAAIAAVVLIAKGLDAAIETNKEKLENATDAAAAASDAYDSVKQETSELADSIAQIEETDSAFDNLVAGTAEFNEQLVTANEQISELLDKYPMLNDPKYLTTDKNGRMRINQAGLDAVKEYQKQIQANASAMNLIQTADLNALENQQKADNLRKTKSGMTAEEVQKNDRDADLLEQRIEAETALARQNAIRVSLADKELRSAETMSKIMADQYETKRESAEIDVNAMDKHERRQAYADFHGYTYEKSTKKIKDIEGNEVDYDDDVIKDEVIEQQVILEFQEDAESLERTLSTVDSKFADSLEKQTAGSAHVISDILSSNIETDEEILKEILSEPNKLQDVVDDLSEAQIAALLGISASSITDSNIDQYKEDIVNQLTDKATNIAEAQAESYAELGAMMAKAQGNILDKDGNLVGQKGKTNKQIEQAISQQIDNLKPEYAHLMSSVGSQLEEFAGEDTMAAFVNAAYDIYNAQGEDAGKTINEFNNLINDTNFDSAISRLTFYNKAMNSSNAEIQKVAKNMKETTGEANLLGKAFDEFLGSSDWAEISENADDFKNVLGEYDAAGIQEAAEQSRTLKELLDSGAISAGGVAAALQGMDDGSITNLNSTVLTLLSSFNRLADVASEAHKIIEGFDPGIDTGEGEEFVTENAEKFKEYYDNGEFGNEQLQNYIKLAAGADEWNKALRRNKGDLRETAKELKHYVTAFDEGFVPVYDKLTQGLDLQGNQISDEVKKEYKGLEFLWDENGELQINLADFGTEDLQAYLQKALGISEEYAKLMLQNLANYDTQLSSQLRANDIKKSLGNKDFQESHQDSQGRFILSDSDIRAVGANLELENDINTQEGLEEATEAMEKLAGTEIEVFRSLNEDGSEREDYDQLLADYAKSFYSTEGKDLFGIQELQQGGKFDVGKLISDGLSKGAFASQSQANQAAYEAVQQAKSEGIQELLYNGQTLDLSEITSMDDFLAATQKLTDSAQWYEVGQSIAEGIINYIDGKDTNEPNTPKKEDTSDKADDSSKGKDSSGESKMLSGEAPQWAQTSRDSGASDKSADNFIERVGKWLNTNPVTGEVKDTSATTTTESSTATSEGQVALDTAVTSLSDASTQLTTAGESLNTAATNLTNAAAILAGNPPKQSKETSSTTSGIPSNVPQPQQSSVSGAIVVDNSVALQSLDDVKAKAEETKSTIETGAVFKIDVSGGIKKLTKAANAAQKITKNSGEKSINVSANASGTEQTNKLSTAVKNFRKLNSKTIKLKADTSGLAGTIALTTAAKAFHRLTDKTITLKTIKETVTKDNATGAHNHGYAPAPPKAGSAARGSYGQVGPKGKGGMTLTGELGYEIAWIPSENRSMILGANGPQMVNLPGDAVVWTHEQSKKIMNQKSIPAGSHANTSIKRPGGGGSRNNGKKPTKTNSTDKIVEDTAKTVKQVTGKVSVWWENMTRRVENNQRKVDNSQKKFEKLLKTFGKTAVNAQGVAKDYRAYLNKSITLNQAEVKKANSELKSLDKKGRTSISYEVTKKKKGKETKETKKATVNLGNYIRREKDGTYVIDQKKLNKVAKKNKSKAEAIKTAAEQKINDKVSKKNKAQDEIDKAREALEKISNDIYQTFYAWEKSITRVYLLSQKLDTLSKQLSTDSSKLDLQFAKIEAGAGTASQGLSKITTALADQRNNLLLKAEGSKEKVSATRQEFLDSMNLSSYLKKLGKNPNSTDAKNDFKAAQKALEILDKANLSGANFDYTAALKAINSKEISKDEYDAIKGVLDGIFEKQGAYLDATSEGYQSITEIYQQMEEYQSFIAEFEESLLSGIEEQVENQIKHLDKLNSALTKAYKDLLDEVRRRLDERRKQEDNAKTESDISRKQQRLAMLRADTSGGHQTEIAQLEQEIAESQQNYQRTLEDQLLERLQHQGDEAEKQRQRQIELLEVQNQVAQETGTNLAQVKEWLKNPEANYEQIRSAWLANHNYDELPPDSQKQLEEQFEVEWAKYQGYSAELKEYEKQTGHLKSLESKVDEIAKEVKLDGVRSVAEMKAAGVSASTMKAAGYNPSQLLAGNYNKKEVATAGYNYKALKEAKLTDKDIAQAVGSASAAKKIGMPDKVIAQQFGATAAMKAGVSGATVQKALGTKTTTLQKIINKSKKDKATQSDLAGTKATIDTNGKKKGGSIKGTVSSSGKTAAANKGSTLYTQNINTKKGTTTGKVTAISIDKLTPAQFKANKKEATDALISAIKNKKIGSKINKNMQNFVSTAGIAGKIYKLSNGIYGSVGSNGKIYYNKGKEGVQIWDAVAGKVTLDKYNLKEFKKKAKYKSVGKEYAQVLNKRGIKGYATGGLASFTGPAWLDGTPSKPELVLNATDTKNFLALKDVLGKAMSSTSAVENTYGGDAMYEININVDKIEKDYDVDRVIDKVKKEITKGAGYRNVTQVRNFR